LKQKQFTKWQNTILFNPVDTLTLGFGWYVVFVLSLSFHEAAHAFAAMKLGDKTAFYAGQVSLHPLAHIRRSPVGMVVLPIVSFLLNGWMIGWASTPYDPAWARRFPRREMLMAAAGPLANLLLVLAAAIIIRAGVATRYFYPPENITFSRVTVAYQIGWANSIAIMTSILFTLNLILLVFNLLPVPPLDGSCLLPLLLSGDAADRYSELISRPGYSIIGLVIAWQIFGYIFDPVHTFALNLLYPGIHYGR
jgi:Zn-dependent protease